MSLSLHNRMKFQCSRMIFEVLLRKTRKVLKLKEETISLAIINEREMRNINRQYQGVDASTDVLSFDYGEILLCPAHIKKKYCLKSAREIKEKMRELFVHGLVHIAGFDHKTRKDEEKMSKVEEKILAS
ncbi:MAG TPA: rRNA maturation RNase YbeY [Candidatus Jacksonbacteria bacterium]|nr:rRNA maturation RNase YbeY [Candidatus Jacksonbacteria bacterium]HCE86702.1 rRNA maturation RNase YbeY [Candidatus Jacksonbacteria bacterium]